MKNKYIFSIFLMVMGLLFLIFLFAGKNEVEAAVYCACAPCSCCDSGGGVNGTSSGNCTSTPAYTYCCEYSDPHNINSACDRWCVTQEVDNCGYPFCTYGSNSDGDCCDNPSCSTADDGPSQCCTDGCSAPPDGGDPEPPAESHNVCSGTSCVLVAGAGTSTCATNAQCVPGAPTYTVSGTVYRTASLGECSGTGLGAILPGTGSLAIVSGYAPVSVNASGQYSVSGIYEDTKVVRLIPGDATTWRDSCEQNFTESVYVDGNKTINWYVTDVQGSWWQARGGDVGANMGDVITSIPATCTGTCKPYVMLLDAVGTTNSNGAMWYGLGTGYLRYGYNVAEGTSDFAPKASYSTLTKRESYDYFYRLFEMGISPTEDSVLSDNESNMRKPDTTTESPGNGRAYFVRAGDGTGTVTIDTAWDLTPGESLVVFVDGDLEVNQPVVTDVGDFVAFIVSGDITFNLGNAVPSLVSPNVEGVFVADGQIITSTSSEQFVGSGIFIGWGGVDMNRDFGNSTNNTNPAEFFSYRPDFVTNAPAQMKRPVIRWEEVAP